MKKLILCIDRDDDIGSKTGIDTPIIGRKANLKAAVKLGLKDPEDSDTNSLFSAISTYDNLKKKGEDVVIATVCGSQSIGYKSDLKLSSELDVVLKELTPDTVVIVSDGAEDEYVTPIVSSKVDISHVKTVYIKQSESVENIYYMLVKSLQEERAKKKILLPISLALLVYGFFGIIGLAWDIFMTGGEALIGLSGYALTIISFILGVYIFVRIHDLDQKMYNYYKDIRDAISTAAVWLPFTVVGVLIVLGGAAAGWNAVTEMLDESPLIQILTFFQTVIWWWIVGIFLHELGQVIHIYLSQGKIKKSFWAVVTSLLALTFILWGTFDYIQVMIYGEEVMSVLPMVAVNMTLGLCIAILGGLTHRAVKGNDEQEDE